MIGAGSYEDELYETAHRVQSGITATLWWSLGIGGATLVAAAIVAFFLGGTIASPIRAIALAASDLANGKLDRSIDHRSSDETGQLADSFREMQGQLRRIAAQTSALVDATNEGELSVRADAAGFEGGWRRMIEGLNHLADAYVAPIRITANYVDRIAKGDIPPKIAETYRGDFNAIKNNLNRCIDAVKRLIDDAQGLVTASVEGRLDHRADETRHEGDFARIIGGVNKAVGALVGHLDAMPAAAMLIDTDFNIRYLNNSGCTRMLGRNKGDLIGSKCYDYMKTADCRTEKCAAMRAMRSGGSATGETQAHPLGETHEISYTGVALHDAQGAVVGALEVISDQTQIKQRRPSCHAQAGGISDARDREAGGQPRQGGPGRPGGGAERGGQRMRTPRRWRGTSSASTRRCRTRWMPCRS